MLHAKEKAIKKVSAVLFHLTWLVMALSAFGVFVAMHRNLFGPSGENMYILRNAWEALCHLVGKTGEVYPPEDLWSGNYLRPALIGFCASYLVALLLLYGGRIGARIQLRTLLIIATIVSIPLLLMPNIWSSDIFDYIVYGRLPVVYHTNPYTTSISEFPTDTFYNMTCWKAAVSVYGPAWSLLSIALVAFCELLRAGPALYVLVFKLTAFACHLVSGALIWKILTRAGSPTRAFGTALYLFNPLAMIEFVGNSHNESFMLAMVMLALMFAQKNRWAAASLAFTLAVQTKFYTLPMFCLYVAYLWWREPRPRDAWVVSAGAVGVFVALSLVLYLPFGINATTVLAPFYGVAASSMTKSLAEFFVFKSPFKLAELPLFGGLFAGNRQQDVQRLALQATFLVCLGGAAYARSLSRAVTSMAFFAFFWSAIGATWFMPWYLTVPVALVSLSGSRKVGVAAVLASMLVFIIYLLEGWSYSEVPGAHNYMVTYFQPYVFGPPILILVSLSIADALSALWRIGKLRREQKVVGEI